MLQGLARYNATRIHARGDTPSKANIESLSGNAVGGHPGLGVRCSCCDGGEQAGRISGPQVRGEALRMEHTVIGNVSMIEVGVLQSGSSSDCRVINSSYWFAL